MARTGIVHHIGTFFLFAATILLIITDISAPVVSQISILKVEVGIDSKTVLFQDDDNYRDILTFGAFGYCAYGIDYPEGECSHTHIGYDPIEIIQLTATDVLVSDYGHDTSRALTKVMVLHPIATVLAFISFFLALGAGFVGSVLAALSALITFVIIIIVLITDFVAFAIVKAAVYESSSGIDADWGVAAKATIAAAVLTLLASVILLFSCCSARIHRKREGVQTEVKEPAAPGSKRRWFGGRA